MTARQGAWAFVAVLTAATIAGILLCDNKTPPVNGDLIEFGFTLAIPEDKPIHTPHDKPPYEYPLIVSGTGVFVTDSVLNAGDSLNVKLTVLDHGGIKYVQVTIDDKPVHWMELKSYYREEPRNLSAVVDLDCGFDVSLGLAWEPVRLWGWRGGVFAVTDLDDISGGLRVSRRVWRGLSFGIDGGYGTDGVHVGISAGVAF